MAEKKKTEKKPTGINKPHLVKIREQFEARQAKEK
jgi:hypothetical protein